MWKPCYSWLAICCIIAGCAQWSNLPTGELAKLSLPNLRPDTVVLEVDFVRIPHSQEGFADRLWPDVDEQTLNNDLRRGLQTNGFRGGVIGQVLPAPLQEILDQVPAPANANGESVIQPGEQVVSRSQRLYSRVGHPGKILVRSDAIETLAALTRDPDGQIHGRSLDQARLLFQVKSTPLGSGEISLELTPVIEYGQSRPHYAVQQGVWSLDNTSRSTEIYDDLKVTTKLTPGQSVILTATSPPRGLGQQFFGADPDADVPALILLVRLQQTQLDDRFEQQSTPQPLATTPQ